MTAAACCLSGAEPGCHFRAGDAGLYPVPGLKDVVLQVLKTEINDQDGKVVNIVE